MNRGIATILLLWAMPVLASATTAQIPPALHGCWRIDEPASDEQDAVSATLIVSRDRIVIDSAGVGRREGSVELVERIGPNLIEGRISAVEDGRQITLATTLERDPVRDELLLREGDAGSYLFHRCGPAKDASAPRG